MPFRIINIIYYIDSEKFTLKKYYPDFFIEMESGKTYIVEVKEEHMIDSEVVKKSRATKEITSPQSNLSSWQSKIIKVLTETFPKVQFIFTTHSPSVISNILNENILVLNNLEIYKLNDKTYGRDIESIVREVMRTEVRPQEIVKKLKEFNKLLDDGKIEDARKLLKSLEEILGQNDTKIIDARISLELEEIGV